MHISQVAHIVFFLLSDLLINQGKSCLLAWLQQVLLDACYAKLNGSSITTPDGELLEPVPHYYNSKLFLLILERTYSGKWLLPLTF
jgi:hypothetical protein